jgi:hypothetical protein
LESNSHGTINKLSAIKTNITLVNADPSFNEAVQQPDLTAGGLFKFWDMDADF